MIVKNPNLPVVILLATVISSCDYAWNGETETVCPANTYYAMCANKHDFMGNGWFGPKRCNKWQAEDDASNHEKANPNHDATVYP